MQNLKMFPLFLVLALVSVFGIVMLTSQDVPQITIPSSGSIDSPDSMQKILYPEFVYDKEFISFVDARIFEVYSGHAWQEHGDEVNKAFRCLSDKGSSRAFKTTGFYKEGNNCGLPKNPVSYFIYSLFYSG